MMWKVGKAVAIKRLYQQLAMQDKCLPCGVIMLMYCWIHMGILVEKKGNWTLLQRQ